MRHIMLANASTGDREARWIDIAASVLLPLATVASAWCAFQASVWSGLQTFRLSAANEQRRLADEQLILAQEHKLFDTTLVLRYLEARAEGKTELGRFLRRRFRRELEPTVSAWLAQQPMTNPSAPNNPTTMPSYNPPEEQKLRMHQKKAQALHAQAQTANTNGDKYVFLTVLYASVLFFGGLATKVDQRFMRLTMLIVGVVIFLACSALLLVMPVAAGGWL
jgi:hypothetical protein